MEIKIIGTPKEIAALVIAVQERQKEKHNPIEVISEAVSKVIRDKEKVRGIDD